MTANRVRVILTHAQVEALRVTVAESEGTLAATRRWGDAAEVTQARRRLHSARLAVVAMDAALARQRMERQERTQRAESQTGDEAEGITG
jgi:hypothetical protein